MSEPSIHLVVGTPCHGGMVTSAYFSSVMKLQESFLRGEMPLTFLTPDGGDLVERARQEIVADFMAIPGATHLLFIDSDIGFEPEQVHRLIRFNADIAAAIYPLKRIDWEKAGAAALAGRENLESAGLHYVMEMEEPFQTRDEFFKVRSAGTGFFLMKRAVIEAMMERHPELRYENETGNRESGQIYPRYALFNCLIDGESGAYLSEDYSFCRRWTKMGGEIWVDQRSRLQHVGPVTFKGDIAPPPIPVPKPGGPV